MSRSVMFHVVAGYPTNSECLSLMIAMQKAGAQTIEVQVPFSDPIADGEAIMGANDQALENGMTTAGTFDLIRRARAEGVYADIFVMSYLQKLVHFGFDKFCHEASAAKVSGLIIPDMPIDSPEFGHLTGLAAPYDIEIIPVLSPGMPSGRLKSYLATAPITIYVTSRRGITGIGYAPTSGLAKFIAQIQSRSTARIMLGFGISTPDDVNAALKICDTAVIGSAVIRKLQITKPGETFAFLRSLVAGSEVT